MQLAHLIKSEDLNHHGTLFAGRMAEWFVEAAFIAASDFFGNPEGLVCIKLHGLKFSQPAKKGQTIIINPQIAEIGTTSITVYGKVVESRQDTILVEGFATFVCVDSSGKKIPHGLTLPEPFTEEDRLLRDTARKLRT
jgi:acyl-CoA hydrolase